MVEELSAAIDGMIASVACMRYLAFIIARGLRSIVAWSRRVFHCGWNPT